MGLLIDSSVLIHFERSGTDISTYIKGREEEESFVSVCLLYTSDAADE